VVLTNFLCTCDLYSPVHNVLDGCIYSYIPLGSGRGLGPGIPEFFGPQMELAYRLVPISQGPKNSGIPGPNPLPLPHVMSSNRLLQSKKTILELEQPIRTNISTNGPMGGNKEGCQVKRAV
jgi:hypothetical protein